MARIAVTQIPVSALQKVCFRFLYCSPQSLHLTLLLFSQLITIRHVLQSHYIRIPFHINPFPSYLFPCHRRQRLTPAEAPGSDHGRQSISVHKSTQFCGLCLCRSRFCFGGSVGFLRLRLDGSFLLLSGSITAFPLMTFSLLSSSFTGWLSSLESTLSAAASYPFFCFHRNLLKSSL